MAYYPEETIDCLLTITRDVTKSRMGVLLTNAFIGTYEIAGRVNEGYFTCDKNYKHKVGDVCAVISTGFNKKRVTFKLKNEYLKKPPTRMPVPAAPAKKEYPRLDRYPFAAFKQGVYTDKLDPPYIGCVVKQVDMDGKDIHHYLYDEDESAQVLYLPFHPAMLDEHGNIQDEYIMFERKLNIYHKNLRWDKPQDIYHVPKCKCGSGSGYSEDECECEKELIGQLKLLEVHLVYQ